ncbi:hypothetical protein MNBD_GAMMA15-1610 [hydrothermal vent metagenome]|uniref:Type II secretion system protein GspB C-terminal domain-containing protein n=1 Tax=hydrothermal vent metagenome TaxID=652676 RepID=A0A3B0Z6D6_9ZZZZ
MARIFTLPLLALLLSSNALALNDPTRPTDPALYFGGGNAGGWALQSILLSDDRRIAIINGKRVREGERIGSARVARIRKSHVVLKTRGRTLNLQLRSDTEKTRP